MIANPNILPSHHVAVAAVIDPDANAAAALTSDWVSMVDFEAVMAIVMAGTFGTSGTLDGKLQQATDSSGTGNKDIAGKAITQLVDGDDDKQAIINCRADELDVEGGFTHVALVMTTAVATGDSGAIVLGFHPHYGPANNRDLASVDEIIA